MFTKALYTKNGDIVTLMESEAIGVMEALKAGEKWIVVQGEMFSSDTIARIGNHEMSAELKRVEHADIERSLVLGGRKDLVDSRRILAEKMSVKNVLRREEEMIAFQSEIIRLRKS
jgi:hypothetical protein